ncbi:hypothetical protein BgiMline_001879 [Biomphalaria glabrata]|nr:hypothetical protein BgiMline_001754 [Biomphalaria glabrata]
MESRMSDRTAATHTLSQCLTVSSKYLCVSTLHTSKVPKSSFKAFSEITDAKVIIPESYQSKTRNKLISTLLYARLNEASLTTSRDKKKQDVSVRVKSSWNNDNERQSNTTPSENVLGLRSNTIQTRVGFTSKPITIRIRGDERPNSTPKKAVLRSRANTRRTGDTVREKTTIQGEEIVKRAEDIRAIADAVILKIAPTGHSATPLTTPAEQGARPLPIPISEDGIRRNAPSTKKSHTSPTGDGSSIRPNAGDGDQRTLNAPPSEARHRPNTTPVGERPRRTTTCQDVVDGVRMRPTTTPSRLRQRHTTTPFEYGAKMRPATTPSGVTNIQRQRYLINGTRSATIPAAQPYCWATNRKDGSQRCQESTWSTQRNHIPAAFNW